MELPQMLHFHFHFHGLLHLEQFSGSSWIGQDRLGCAAVTNNSSITALALGNGFDLAHSVLALPGTWVINTLSRSKTSGAPTGGTAFFTLFIVIYS